MDPAAPITPAVPAPATWHCKSCDVTKELNTSNFYAAGRGFRKTCIPCSITRRETTQKRVRDKPKVAKEDEEKHTKWDDSQQSPEKKRQRLEDARQARRARLLSRNTVLPNAANAPNLPAPLPLPTHPLNPTPQIQEPNVGDEPALELAPEPYIDPVNWKRIQSFHDALDTYKMEVCSRCKERWFEMRLVEGVCYACRSRDSSRKMKEGMPFLMTDLNNMDPGEMPDLPKLT
jgi:hypothetical protein